MDCTFCKIVNKDIPSYKIYEDEVILAFLDINPNSVGHTLIIPKKHTLDLETISNEDLTKIITKAKDIAKLLQTKLGCDGYTLVQNNGFVQEVKHYHLHIIPKYKKKIEMPLEEVYKKIIKNK